MYAFNLGGPEMKMNLISGKIRQASLSDLQDILQLLEMNGLPIIGMQIHLDQFLVWEIHPKDTDEHQIRGCVGLEIYGKYALLRSLSIHPQYQCKGIGTQLLNSIIAQAREMNIANLFLLTTTADSFFEKHHFTRISRENAPVSVRKSVEFKSACPSTAICLTRKM
jgi:amino-acid N-acetyltransferase